MFDVSENNKYLRLIIQTSLLQVKKKISGCITTKTMQIQTNQKHITNKAILLFIVTYCLLIQQLECQQPTAFTIIRSVHPWSNLNDFLTQICKPTYNSQKSRQSSYNMISLSGYTESTVYQTIDNKLSPLSLWKRIYQIVAANKQTPDIPASNNKQLQEYVVDNIFHANGSRLLMHVDFGSRVVQDAGAQVVGTAIVTAVLEMGLDGVSMMFEDYNAVRDGTASEWLHTLLRTIRDNTQNIDFTTVLILPPTLPPKLPFFKSPQSPSLLSYLILKYYNTIKADYKTYPSIFQQSTLYPQTSLMQLLNRSDFYIDICRTLIAKPATSEATWNYMQYVGANQLGNFFMQAYNKYGWFAGYANLDFGADRAGLFVDGVLDGVRDQCIKSQACYC